MNPETQPGQGGNEIDALKAEVTAQTTEQIKKEFIKTATKAAEIQRVIENTIERFDQPPSAFEGQASDKNTDKGKAVDVLKVVRKVLLSPQENKIPTPENKPVEVTTFAADIIKEVSKKVNVLDVSEQTAPYLYELFYKVINGEITDVDTLAQEFKKMARLKKDSPVLLKNIQDALLEVAKKKISEEEARKKFEIKDEEVPRRGREEHFETAFNQQWDLLYARYFDEDDMPLVRAIYNAPEFIKYIRNKRDAIRKQGMNNEDISRELTDQLKGEISALFGKIYQRLDFEHPKELFEEITRKDFYSGIERASIELSGRLNVLRSALSSERIEKIIKEEGLKEQIFFKDAAEEPIDETVKIDTGEKDKEGHAIYIEKPRIRLNPLLTSKEVNLEEFMHHLHNLTETYIEFRRYVHNARSIFLHPPGEKGFYTQLGEYAEKFGMVDFRSMMVLPDAEIFTRAFNLYDKFIEEEFAKNDGKHHESMFTNLPNETFTALEFQVLDQLRRIYKGDNISENRLRSALSMAVGASRGIFLNEPEKASFADPPLKEGGKKAAFTSYYTQDAAPLMVFDPVRHFPIRFQTEGAMMHPIYFLSFKDAKAGFFGLWNHNQVYKNMQAFKDVFFKGRRDIMDKELFIDFCNNIGKIGGPFQRKGWRTESWFKNYFLYDKDDEGNKTDRVLAKETWKELENIGYEALHDFVHWNRMSEDFLKKSSVEIGKKKINLKLERADFFGYLYEKYYSRDLGSLDDYLKNIKEGEAKENVYKEVREGKKQPIDLKEEIEFETSRIFLYRTLSRVIARRFPSKFIRIDRDRFHSGEKDDPKSRWNVIREAMGLDHAKFDKVVKNYLLTEDILRKKVSDQMIKGLRAHKGSLREIEGIEYKMNPDEIRNELAKRDVSKEEIDQVIKLHEKLKIYSNDNNFLNSFAKDIQTGKYKFTFAIDETDLRFVPFEAGGPRVLPRVIKDMATTEEVLSQVIIQYPKLLHKVATDGKGDFSEVVATIQKAKEKISGVLGPDDAAEIAYRMAVLTINYFKKDTSAKWLFGIFGFGHTNSIAAELAGGRGNACWEWDSRTIDRFCTTLETADILKRKPILFSSSKPDYVPYYMSVFGNLIKLPYEANILGRKIPLFRQRKKEINWYGENLRKEGGAKWNHMLFEAINGLIPLALILLAILYLRKAMQGDEGKK